MTEWVLLNVAATKWHAVLRCNKWYMQRTVEHIITIYHNLCVKVSIAFRAILNTRRVSVRIPPTNFHATSYYGRFWKIVWQVKIWLKSENFVGHLTWRIMYVYCYLRRDVWILSMFSSQRYSAVSTGEKL